ncbi:MAG: DUF2007 domain-containing protein [Bacteroidota bacterium]|nr:DUF2007 domain-containing protein [Bacteroidota bacterium]
MMEDNWVSVFTTDQPYLADIVKQVLQENNIVSVVINKIDSSYSMFGEVEVYVDRDLVIKAKSIIENIES